MYYLKLKIAAPSTAILLRKKGKNNVISMNLLLKYGL